MTYEEARKQAQADANSDGYFRYVVPVGSEWEVREQDKVEEDVLVAVIVWAEDKCRVCGKREPEVELHYHCENGQGYEHTDAGDYCRQCWIDTVQGI